MVDSGLCAALGRLTPEQWIAEAERFGSLLESHVVEQLIAQAGKRFRGGMLIHTGRHCLKLQVPGCFAVPIGMLWGEELGQPISAADVLAGLGRPAPDVE